MILGIGNDIVEVKRIRDVIERHELRFLNRLFTPQEQDYCLSHKDPVLHFAGRFAAKEAIVKALGTGFREGIDWIDFEIMPNNKGKPVIKLSEKIQIEFKSPLLHLSISHCQAYATAVAIWES
jgi:holo-[acyl-carrier protein] synthase